MSSDRLPWGKFVWSDWENDPALALVSMGAQGFWMRLLCLAVKEGGYVLVGGVKPEPVKLARLCRCSVAEAEEWLAELEAEKVFSRTGDGVIYSRRMIREAKLSRRNRENGAKGGNPTLRKTRGNGASDNPEPQPPAQPPSRKGVKAEENREEESREDHSVSNETGADAPDAIIEELSKLEPASGAWKLAKHVLTVRGGMTAAKAGDVVGKWMKGGAVPVEALWDAAEAAWRCGTEDPVAYMTAAIREERNRAPSALPFGPRLRNPPERQQRAWAEDWAAGDRNWLERDRGPPPGQPGCQIAPAILREFGIEPAKGAA